MTTYTGYPDAHAESTSVDGYAEWSGAEDTWANVRAKAGTASGDKDTNVRGAWTTAGTTSGKFVRLRRAVLLFDTSAIPVGATINTVTLTLTGTTKVNTFAGAAEALHVVNSAPASNTAVANGDYGNVGTTSYGSIAYASYNAAGANNISLSVGAVTVAGITKLGLRLAGDQSGTFGSTWGSGGTVSYSFYWADNGSSKPTLTVDYTVSGTRRVMVIS